MARKPNRPLESPDPGTEPAPPYPREYLEGLRLFNAHRFWDCHEALEELWMELDGGPMIAAAYHILTRSPIRWSGARRNLEKAIPKLELYRPRYMGLDVDELCAFARGLRDRLHDAEEAPEMAEAFGALPELQLWPDNVAGTER